MSLTALSAALALSITPAQADARAEFAAANSFGGVATSGGLFYATTPAGRSAIRRLDLTTGAIRTLYIAPDRRTYVSSLSASGGRVAFQTERGRYESAVFGMDAATGAVVELASGRARDRWVCGRAVKLDDVSPAGDALFEDVTVLCSTRRGRLLVRAHGPSGERTLVSRPADAAFLSQGEPHRRLAGEHLLTFGRRLARVRNLASGATRRLRPLTRRSQFGSVELAADGRVLLDEWRGLAHLPEQVVRLVGSGGRGRAGEVVHRSRSAFGEARFCGAHEVLYTVRGRGRLRLRLLDPPSTLAEGLLPDANAEGTCDDAHIVMTVARPRRVDRVYVYDLPT